MNELSMIFARLGISTDVVLKAAGTKWNFHQYRPGMVGGHCIPVDPYYLVKKAKEVGYQPRFQRMKKKNSLFLRILGAIYRIEKNSSVMDPDTFFWTSFYVGRGDSTYLADLIYTRSLHRIYENQRRVRYDSRIVKT